LATGLTLIVVAAFVRLGMWQLQRADEKRALIAQYELGRQSSVELTAANARQLPRYQQVRVRGHYDPAHQILLDNMPSVSAPAAALRPDARTGFERDDAVQNKSPHASPGAAGRPGYRVFTPFRLQDDSWVLVDRGWLPLGATRAELPDVTVSDRDREIVGQFDQLPRPGIQLDQSDIDASGPWPRVLNFPQQPTLERALERELLPGVILLDPQAPDGYQRVAGARVAFGPERHLAYAVQWFAMATAVALIYVILQYRRYRNR
jgi:surfeit locus 1 family protein